MLGRFRQGFCLFYIAALVLVVLGLAMSPARAARYAAIVVDAESGHVLHAVNADTRNYPASLTKMMTLYLVFEALEAGKLKLSKTLTVSAHAASMPPSNLRLRTGDKIKVTQNGRATGWERGGEEG